MNSMQSYVNDLKVRMGELGIVEGPEVKALAALEKHLSSREDYTVAEERSGAGRERKFDKEQIRSMILQRNMGVSYEKIGNKFGCVGMMVRNICRGNVYKDVISELQTDGVTWNGK